MHRVSFEADLRFVQKLGHHFGSLQDLPCKTLKNVLAELEYHRTGRVRLSSPDARGVSGEVVGLSERIRHLRKFGASR